METPQFELFHESIYKALDTCIQALGGAKSVGIDLWGNSTTPDKQGDKLNDCLNPTRAQKLGLDEMLYILRKAHDVGCHAGINFICRDTGYTDPQPVDLEDELAQREREFIQAVDKIEGLAKSIDVLRQKTRAAR